MNHVTRKFSMQSIMQQSHGGVMLPLSNQMGHNKRCSSEGCQRLAPNIQPHAALFSRLMMQATAYVVLTGHSGVGKSSLFSPVMATAAMADARLSSHRLWRPTAIAGAAGLYAFLCDQAGQAHGDWQAQVNAWCAAKRAMVWVIKGAHHLDDQQLMALSVLSTRAKQCAAPIRVVLMGKASLARRFVGLSKHMALASMPTVLSLQPMTMQQSQQFLRQYAEQQGIDIAAMGMDRLLHMHQQAGGLPRALCRMMAAYSKAHMQTSACASKPPAHVVEQGIKWCKQHPASWLGVGMMAGLMVMAMCFHAQPMMVMPIGEHAQHVISHMRARTTVNVASLAHVQAAHHGSAYHGAVRPNA
jgi:type II secretory pathway predicted ATPase ExeA